MHISTVIGGKARYHIRRWPYVVWVRAVCTVHVRIWTLINAHGLFVLVNCDTLAGFILTFLYFFAPWILSGYSFCVSEYSWKFLCVTSCKTLRGHYHRVTAWGWSLFVSGLTLSEPFVVVVEAEGTTRTTFAALGSILPQFGLTAFYPSISLWENQAPAQKAMSGRCEHRGAVAPAPALLGSLYHTASPKGMLQQGPPFHGHARRKYIAADPIEFVAQSYLAM